MYVCMYVDNRKGDDESRKEDLKCVRDWAMKHNPPESMSSHWWYVCMYVYFICICMYVCMGVINRFAIGTASWVEMRRMPSIAARRPVRSARCSDPYLAKGMYVCMYVCMYVQCM